MSARSELTIELNKKLRPEYVHLESVHLESLLKVVEADEEVLDQLEQVLDPDLGNVVANDEARQLALGMVRIARRGSIQ